MTEIEELRTKATHARRLATLVNDANARLALYAFADELDRKAAELERLQNPSLS